MDTAIETSGSCKLKWSRQSHAITIKSLVHKHTSVVLIYNWAILIIIGYVEDALSGPFK